MTQVSHRVTYEPRGANELRDVHGHEQPCAAISPRQKNMNRLMLVAYLCEQKAWFDDQQEGENAVQEPGETSMPGHQLANTNMTMMM